MIGFGFANTQSIYGDDPWTPQIFFAQAPPGAHSFSFDVVAWKTGNPKRLSNGVISIRNFHVYGPEDGEREVSRLKPTFMPSGFSGGAQDRY